MTSNPSWYNEDRTSTKFIRDLNIFYGERTWGFVVFRTTYTPESDKSWPQALQKMEKWAKWTFNFDRLYEPEKNLDPEPDRIAGDALRTIVIEDPVLDGASMEQVRERFQQWREEVEDNIVIHGGGSAVCLVIDEASMMSLNNAPEPSMEHTGTDPSNPWVWAVDGEIEEIEDDDELAYRGWMRVEVESLARLYQTLVCIMQPMEEICPYLEAPGQIPVFNGDPSGALLDSTSGTYVNL